MNICPRVKTIDLFDLCGVLSYCLCTFPSTTAPTPPVENAEQFETYGDLVIGEFGFNFTNTPRTVALFKSLSLAVNVMGVAETVCAVSTSTCVVLRYVTTLVPTAIPVPLMTVPTKSGSISPVELVKIVPEIEAVAVLRTPAGTKPVIPSITMSLSIVLSLSINIVDWALVKVTTLSTEISEAPFSQVSTPETQFPPVNGSISILFLEKLKSKTLAVFVPAPFVTVAPYCNDPDAEEFNVNT